MLSRSFFFAVISAFAIQAAGSTESLKFGVGVPLSGPNSADGPQRVKALTALSKKINDAGGIHGKKVEFKISDNEIDPKLSTELVKKFVESDKVLALFSIVGTPVASAILPYVEKTSVPFFAPVTGGEFVTRPLKKSVFAMRPNFLDEAEALIEHAVTKSGNKEVGLFFRDDALGMAGRKGIVAALEKRGLKPVAFGSHARSEKTAERGVEEIMKVKPKVVVLWTINATAVDFAKRAAEKGYKPTYYAPSPIVPSMIIKEGAAEVMEGGVFASGYPDEQDETIPAVKEFREAMAAAGFKSDEMTPFAFETYFNGVVLMDAVKRAGPKPSRDGLVAAIEKMSAVEFGGLKVSFGKNKHQGLDKVYLLQMKGGRAIPL